MALALGRSNDCGGHMSPIPPTTLPLLATKLLGSIVCTPSSTLVGQSVRVEVKAPNGAAHDNHETVPISINGVPGSTQYLSWDYAGTYVITAIAHRRGAMEKMTTTIKVDKPSGGRRPPSLRVQWRPDEATVAQFSLLRGPTLQRRGKPSRMTPAQAAQPLVIKTRPGARISPVEPRRARTRPPGGGRAGSGTQPVTYEWDFGDGVKLGTLMPSIAHDYGPRLDGTHLYQMFHVSVSFRIPGEQVTVLRRTITVHNHYVALKRRGRLQPLIADTDLSAKYVGGTLLGRPGYHATITVRNPEPFDLILTQRRIERIYGEDDRFSETLAPETVNVVLRANDTTLIPVFVAQQLLPIPVIGFAAHYSGTAANTMPVRVTAHFDLPQHLPSRFMIPAALNGALDKLASRNVISNPRSIGIGELRRFELQGILRSDLLTTFDSRLPVVMKSHMEPPKAIEGKDCDPWNLPEVIPDGMFCLPTSETRKVKLPPRFMNAKKGDIVLSPGDGGLIADVLAAVTPPQPFSHSGIMTRNRDEITHSTAADHRIMGDFAGTDGIRPDVLKYLWPGAITQTIDAAVNGESMVDPETGDTYKVSGFTSELGQLASPEITAPMVVKPDPLVETQAIRSKLQDVANIAIGLAGNCHYRFFCYTDPTIGVSSTAPAEAKWAAGTKPTVCSSLIWMAIKQAGLTMEGALEPADLDGGAQIALNTPDGLYRYDAEERLAAGEVLFNRLHLLIMLQAPGWYDALTDIADDISNQILNTFASDWAAEDAKDSEKWRDTTDANAVSPQNLMFYDGPHYGFSEPLIFRDWRVEDVVVHKWKKVSQTGTIKGVVRFKASPVQGANVQLSVSQFTASKTDGTFEISGAPAGSVLLEIQKVQDNMLLTAQLNVDVQANQTVVANIDLQAPSHVFRRIRVEGFMATTDYEFAAAAYPHCVNAIEGIIDLDPGTATHRTKTFECACDDAVGKLYVTCDLRSDDSVKVTVKLRCYNSDEASGDDYSQAQIDSFIVEAGQTWSGWIYSDDDNYTEADFTVTNSTNQS
jgi:hypothetical protein